MQPPGVAQSRALQRRHVWPMQPPHPLLHEGAAPCSAAMCGPCSHPSPSYMRGPRPAAPPCAAHAATPPPPT